MSASISSLFPQITPDPWRLKEGFSEEVTVANRALFDCHDDEDRSRTVLADWISTFQPCLFGKVAANLGLLEYCILDEDDLKESDEFIRDKIQSSRTQWTRDGFEGRKSGFILATISPTLATAQPDEILKQIAVRLCSLYLLTDVEPDRIFLDEIFLEIPGNQRATFAWPVGVNYFSSQGDRRWWQDHRFPGGMAFSMNSVGHMVKSGLLAKCMKDAGHFLAVDAHIARGANIDSLNKALLLAMRTIASASHGPSGPATKLVSMPELTHNEPNRCPVDLPAELAGNDYTQYFGHYHTDVSIPSEYFRPDVERPAHLQGHALDFTYLFKSDVSNPDHDTMGRGRRIRDDQSITSPIDCRRKRKMSPDIVDISTTRLSPTR